MPIDRLLNVGNRLVAPALANNIYALLGVFGRFEDISGGDYAMDRRPYMEAGGRGVIRLRGRGTVSDIVLRRVFRAELDFPVIGWAKDWIEGNPSRYPITVIRLIKRYLAPYLEPIEPLDLYPDCKCIGLSYPEGKSGDNTPAYLTLTLTRDT